MNPASSRIADAPHSETPVLDAATAISMAREAAIARNKPLAVQHINAIEPTLGSGWSPAKYNLRAAQAAVDISRWDLVMDRLTDLHRLTDPHSSVEG